MRSNQLSYLAKIAEQTAIKFGADLLSRPSGSTIGAGGLNFSVRDGKRWVPAAVGAFSLLAGGFPPAGAIAMNRARTKGGAGDLTGY